MEVQSRPDILLNGDGDNYKLGKTCNHEVTAKVMDSRKEVTFRPFLTSFKNISPDSSGPSSPFVSSTVGCYNNMPNVRVLTPSNQLRELHTVLRDISTSRSDFIFFADRLIRLVVEEGLNCLPYEEKKVVTPTGVEYAGVTFTKGNCGVSIMRSGEAMERGLRDCCRSIRIGKILIKDDDITNNPQPVYVKLPACIDHRKILLMYPVLGHGFIVAKAVELLTEEYNVPVENILLLTLFSSEAGISTVHKQFPDVTILTSEVHDLIPFHFCKKYFGTD